MISLKRPIVALFVSMLFGNILFAVPTASGQRVTPKTNASDQTRQRGTKAYVLHMNFAPGSAILYAGGKKRLSSIIDEWRNKGAIAIDAVGHTSNEPVPEHSITKYPDNRSLSLARATAVAEYLAGELEVPDERVAIVGRGEDEPLVSNDSREGRAVNERILIEIELLVASPHPAVLIATPNVPRLPGPLVAPTFEHAQAGRDANRAAPAASRARTKAAGPAESVMPESFARSRILDQAEDLQWVAAYDGGEASLFTSPFANLDRIEDDAIGWDPGSWRLPAIWRHQPQRLSNTSWAGNVRGTLGSAYNSNVYDRTSSEISSSTIETAFEGTAVYGIHTANQVVAWGLISATPYTGAPGTDERRNRFGAAFRRQLSRTLFLSLLAEGRIENDDFGNTEGENPLHDFSHRAFRGQPTVHFTTPNNSTFLLSYVVQRTDYAELDVLNSLDWTQHGPSIRFRTQVGGRGDIAVNYAFRARTYDEELASLRSGRDQPQNPIEKHNFDRLNVDYLFRPVQNVEVRFGGGLERKEDRFVAYESWTNRVLRSGFRARFGSRFTVRGLLLLDSRTYANRKGDDDKQLAYTRMAAQASMGVRLFSMLSLYGSVWTANRNTNLSSGGDYRDLEIFRVSSGATFTY